MPDVLPKPAVTAAKADKKPSTRDQIREGLETVVFVVVLVFLLKQFVVEAFVIPTGSMAETLYGYQKVVTCGDCLFEFPLNSSVEVDPPDPRDRRPVMGYTCPNCGYKHAYSADDFQAGKVPGNASGDRVLVNKWLYHITGPTRGDVVVFKYPEEPQKAYAATNYIKRLWGLPGETLAIWRGDLYVTTDLDYPPDARGDEAGSLLYPRPKDPNEAWKGNPMRGQDYRYTSGKAAEAAAKLFEESKKAGFPDVGPGFKLVRKTDEQARAMRRIVYDNDHPSPFLAKRGVPPRWKADGWTADDPATPKAFTHAGPDMGWVRYRHLLIDDRGSVGGPQLPKIDPAVIGNTLGYNSETGPAGNLVLNSGADDHRFWVGDLSVECTVDVTDPAAVLTLELSKGMNRFQARFGGGTVTLVRTGPDGKEIGRRPTRLTGTGRHHLAFSNVDCRLRVWVDGRLIDFGTDADYAPHVPAEFDPNDLKQEGWFTANDVNEPAGVGAAGGVTVSGLKLWRDSYFINLPYSTTTTAVNTVTSYYVQPGHYLCLGDNSAQSSDSRVWGTVPERLLLGKAAFVFFPLDRIGFIK